jgi:hypothetical protein
MSRKKIIYLSLFLLLPTFIFVGSAAIIYAKQKVITQNALLKINEEFIGALTIEDSYISPFANFDFWVVLK